MTESSSIPALPQGVTLSTLENGLTIIVFQFPLLKLLRHYDLTVRTQAGVALFVVGFLAFSMLPVGSYAGWIAATFVLSMGEALLFPTLNLQADRMAPDHLKGSYFGAIALSNLGFAAGPLLGGVMLLVGLVIAGLTGRIRRQVEAARQREVERDAPAEARDAVAREAGLRSLPKLTAVFDLERAHSTVANRPVSALVFSALNLTSALLWASTIMLVVTKLGPSAMDRVGLHGWWGAAVPAVLVLVFFNWLGRPKKSSS